jgi:predicted DNA binding CopG/RHH family protein
MENNKMKFDVLNKEEADIVKAVENEEFSAVGDIEDRADYWQAAVKETIKRKSIHLKLQERDVQKIRAIAYEQGIPYQTLIGSIIHQYAKNAEPVSTPK